MAYTTTEVITEAYYTSGVVGRDFETVTGSQQSDGLRMLNRLLAFKTANSPLIPFHKRLTGVWTQGQGQYFIENLVSVDTLTFFLNNVRFPMRSIDRDNYYDSSRVENITTLPCIYHAERQKGGSLIDIYFEPDQAYTYELWGKFGLDQVALGEDLSEIYELNYINYLIYALAQYICQYNSIMLQPDAANQLLEFEKQLRDMSPLDMVLKKTSTLQAHNRGMNWAMANLYRGWMPG